MTRLLFLRDARRVTFAAALLCCALLLALRALAADFVGQTVKASGAVEITRSGETLSAGQGTALELGDVIKTGPGARLRMRFVDGSILTMGENSTLSIDIFSVDATNNSRTVVLTMLEGIVNAVAAKSGESRFDYQIKTPNAYSAVRGTKWIVSFLKQKTGVYVLNGLVEMGPNSTGAKPVFVPAGNWGSVDAQGRLGSVSPTTPDVLKPLLEATSDFAGIAPRPSTGPVQPTLPAARPNNPRPSDHGSNGSGAGGSGAGGGGAGGGGKGGGKTGGPAGATGN